MNIVNVAFKNSVIEVLAQYGFRLDNTDRKYNVIYHDDIDRFILEYREFHGRISLRLDGTTITNSRKIDYYEDDEKALVNLTSRLKRILKNEREHNELRVKRDNANRDNKAKIAEKIDDFNNRKGGHSIVVDPDSLEDTYSQLTVFYRSYEFIAKVDEEGLLFTRQNLLNKPTEDLPLDKLTGIVDILVD